MAQFKDLPNEIIIMIAESVFPGDLENFSATSKDIQCLSEPSLRRHHDLKRKYKKYSSIWKPSPVANLLFDVILHPIAALYVECLTIDTWWEGWDDDVPEQLHIEYPQEKMMRLREAVAGFVPPEQFPDMDSSDEGPLLALLLLQLPNVATLKLKSFGMTCHYLFETLTRILETPGAPYLSNLTTLQINSQMSRPDAWCNDWQAMHAFAALPSLRSIIAWNLWIREDEDEDEYLLDPRSSNVSSLIFTCISISAQRLSNFLQGFKDLKRFSYKNALVFQEPFETLGIRTALLTHAKASLEYLSLIQLYANKKGYMGSLRDFEKLKELHTDLDLFCDTPHSGRVVLAEMLPASIEDVHLYKSLYDPEDFRDLILTTAEDKPKLLPRLQQLHFRYYVDQIDVESDPTMIAEMEEVCRDAGFELIVD